MGLSYRSRRSLELVVAAMLAALVGLVCSRARPSVDIVKRAAGIPDKADGVEKFIYGAHALVLPALPMTAAVAPLALIAGGLILLFGGRRGMPIIGTALGVLLILSSVTAIVD